MMHITQRQEQFSFAYIRAVSSVAGFAVTEASVDDDSIDLNIASRSTAGTVKKPRLEAQVKCLMEGEFEGDRFGYPVKIKNYDDLRHPDVLVPRILIVVRVPDEPDNWLNSSDTELTLLHCGYWASLRGLPDTENANTVSIPMLRDNRFTVESLRTIMQRIEQGHMP